MTIHEKVIAHLNKMQSEFDNIINFLWEDRKDGNRNEMLDYLDNSFPDITHEINKTKAHFEKLNCPVS